MDRVNSWREECGDFEDSLPARSATTAARREITLKLLLLGDVLVGKTSLVQRYVNNVFKRAYKETIGVDFAVKVIQWSPDLTIKLHLWDVAGMERLGAVTRAYYRNSHGCLLMFDLTDQSTFNRVSGWKEDLDSNCRLPDGSIIPCLLLGNKSDVTGNWSVSRDDMESLSRRYQFSSWREISVKDNVGVDEAISFLIQQMMGRVMGHQQAADTTATYPRRPHGDQTTIVLAEPPPTSVGRPPTSVGRPPQPPQASNGSCSC